MTAGPARLLLLASLLVARGAGAATSVLIDFENLPSGTTVSAQYASSYVVFGGGPRIASYAFAPDFPHSGLQTLEPCYALEFCTTPLAASFSFAARRVKVWVGPRNTHSVNALVFTLRALDANGGEIARSEVTLPPSDVPDTVHYPLEVIADGIAGVEVSVGPGVFDNEQLAVDDFEMTLADPVCGNAVVEPGEECDPAAPETGCSLATPSCVACRCLPRCGNGLLDEGEICDDGDLESTTDCCARDCTPRFVGEACGDPSSSACDGPDRCNAQGVCDPSRIVGVECRAAGTTDACDAGDVCDGTSLACPTAGIGGACRATVPEAPLDRPVIPVTCESVGADPARCRAVGFAEGPAGVANVLVPRQNLVRVTRARKAKLARAGAALRRRVLKLRLNRLGKRLLRQRGALDVTVRVSIRRGSSERTVERLVRILRRS